VSVDFGLRIKTENLAAIFADYFGTLRHIHPDFGMAERAAAAITGDTGFGDDFDFRVF